MKRFFSHAGFGLSVLFAKDAPVDKGNQTEANESKEQETQTVIVNNISTEVQATDEDDAEARDFLKDCDFNTDPTLSNLMAEALEECKGRQLIIKEKNDVRPKLRTVAEFIRKTCSVGGTVAENKLAEFLKKNGVELDHLHSMDAYDYRIKLRMTTEMTKELLESYTFYRSDFRPNKPANLNELVRNFCWFDRDDKEFKDSILRDLGAHLVSLENIPNLSDPEFKDEMGITDDRVICKLRRAYMNVFLSSFD